MEKLDPEAFEFAAPVRYSETTHDGMMSLPALIDLFQDCSIFHSERIGYGPALLKAEHKAWVLTHWHIVVDRYPKLAEQITVGTFASSFKTVSAGRDFYLRDAEGAVIARAHSTWGFMDLSVGKPVRPAAEHVAAYGLGTPLEMPKESRKIALPAAEDLRACDPIACASTTGAPRSWAISSARTWRSKRTGPSFCSPTRTALTTAWLNCGNRRASSPNAKQARRTAEPVWFPWWR